MKVKLKEPNVEAPTIKMHSFIEINLLSFFKIIFLQIIEIVRNKKSIVSALAKTDIILTIRAICSTSLVNSEKKAPSI